MLDSLLLTHTTHSARERSRNVNYTKLLIYEKFLEQKKCSSHMHRERASEKEAGEVSSFFTMMFRERLAEVLINSQWERTLEIEIFTRGDWRARCERNSRYQREENPAALLLVRRSTFLPIPTLLILCGPRARMRPPPRLWRQNNN